MNYTDTVALLAYFTAAWPKFDVTDATIEVWIDEIVDVDPVHANEAMHRLVRELEWPPTIARFIQECRTIATRERHGVQARAGLPAAAAAPPPRELIEATKRMSLEAGSKQHWHGGPGPCPACGGAPIPTRRKKADSRPEPGWCSRCGSLSLPHAVHAANNIIDVEPVRPYRPDTDRLGVSR